MHGEDPKSRKLGSTEIVWVNHWTASHKPDFHFLPDMKNIVCVKDWRWESKSPKIMDRFKHRLHNQ